MKNIWFKVAVLSSLILVCLSATYYFVFYLPKGRAEQEYLNNQIKCNAEGNKLHKLKVEEDSELWDYYNPEFKFNRKLNVCLYKSAYSSKVVNVNNEVSFIINVYENKVIARWGVAIRPGNDQWTDYIGSEQEWNKKVEELFEE